MSSSSRKRRHTPGPQSEGPAVKEAPPEEDTSHSNIPYRRMMVRVAIAISLMTFARFYFGPPEKDFTLLSAREHKNRVFYPVPCSKDYDEELQKFEGCVPTNCGRAIMDGVVSNMEAINLLKLAEKGLSHGGSNGGASILDLHSGALSKGDKFINVYALMNESKNKMFTEDDFNLYRRVKNKIHNLISEEFGISVTRTQMYLTSPTFFSRMTTKKAKTVHDEYWHPHIDKETYGSFHYTSLLYLSTYGKDFTGGRFVFMDKDANRTVEPKLGRLSFFTSGSENLHFVEKLKSGVRYAITVSFTCDPKKAISDPKGKSS